LTIAALLLALLLLHSFYYYPFLSDDSLISLRYSHRLIQGHGLTWTDGERVEGYSNLLWVLATAFLGLLGIDLIVAVRILGLLGMSGTICALFYLYVVRQRLPLLPGIIPALYLVLAAPVAIWVVGGLEQPFIACFLAWGIVFCYREIDREEVRFARWQLPGACFALLCLTRPDGMLFAIAAAIGIVLAVRPRPRAFAMAFSLLALPVTAYLGQLGFRLAYYGEWVPNTAHLKLSFSPFHAYMGAYYIADGLRWSLPLFLPAAVVVWKMRGDSVAWRRLLLQLPGGFLWLCYIIFIGGDVFPGFRHLVPVLVIFSFIIGECAVWITRHLADRRMALSIAVVGLLIFAALQWSPEDHQAAKFERWEWPGRGVGEMLKKAFGASQPLLAVEAAGAIPYWSELPALDMLGLNDYYIAHHPPSNVGAGAIGHEFGDGAYVLGRKPDLMILGNDFSSPVPHMRSGIEMLRSPEFARDYTLATFHADDPSWPIDARIWMRRESPKVGIVRSADSIVIPSYLFKGDSTTVAYLDGSGIPVIAIAPSDSVRITRVPLPVGYWHVYARANRPVTVTATGSIGTSYREGDVQELEILRDGAWVEIVLRGTESAGSEVRSVVLRRAALRDKIQP
jgi:hypothetical protein